jgi:ferredoxin-type protein NapG
MRPPGALSNHFETTCEPFCALCRQACPKLSITTDPFGFPVLHPEITPCVMCTDVPCARVCPTEALDSTLHFQDIRLGLAVIEATVCTAYTGSQCIECYSACPLPEQAIHLIEGLPIIQKDCTGCGICFHACPTSGALSITPLEAFASLSEMRSPAR